MATGKAKRAPKTMTVRKKRATVKPVQKEEEEEFEFASTLSWKTMAVLASIIFLLGMCTGMKDSPTSASSASHPGYKVTGVSKGAVQVIDLQTGVASEIRQQEWVTAALDGRIKRGDVVRP